MSVIELPMDDREFRRIVDATGLHRVNSPNGWAQVVRITGGSVRAVRSYYYGERPVPAAVARAVRRWEQAYTTVKDAETAPIIAATPHPAAPEPADVPSMLSAIGRRVREIDRCVARFCKACEPDGICSNEGCELRPVSPLPLVALRRGAA